MMQFNILVATTLFTYLLINHVSCEFNLTILHTNDIHSRYEEVNGIGGRCKRKRESSGECFGGVARMYTQVQRIREEEENVLFLNAGDYFQGTIWYSVLGWGPTAVFMNKLKYDAMALGNHEFDRGIQGVVPFIQNVTFPVLSSNLDASREPRLKDKIEKSVVLTVGGRRIGVIGYITQETATASEPGDTVQFGEIISSVRKEAESLRRQGVSIIIALGHAGFQMDKRIAEEIPEIDIVVGGHSNTFLYTGKPPSSPQPVDQYPVVVGNPKSLVVQDYAYGKYLGYLKIEFTEDGDVKSWNGNPILLDNSVKRDAEVYGMVLKLREKLKHLKQAKVAKTNVYLEGDTPCRMRECNLGNLISDAYLDAFVRRNGSNWSNVALAIANGGGIRTSIEQGDVTLEDILQANPFSSTANIVSLPGKVLYDVFEHSVNAYDITQADPSGRFLQVSGFKIKFDIKKSPGDRVNELLVRCSDCSVPTYQHIDSNKRYNVVISSFLSNGGDGYDMIKEQGIKYNQNDQLSTDLFKRYLSKISPVNYGEEGRIEFVNPNLKDVSCTSEDDKVHKPVKDENSAANKITLSNNLFPILLCFILLLL